jgi:hypothetical protein
MIVFEKLIITKGWIYCPLFIYFKKRVILLNQKDVKVTPPDISEETLREMAEFFAKTSLPRIIADMKKEKEDEKMR